MGFKFVRLVVKIIVRLIAHVEISGLENLPKQGNCIFTTNHTGRLEVLMIYYVLDRQDIILMIAEKYRKSAFWRWFAKMIDGIFIDRYNADLAALREAMRRLKAGGWLVVAPEGTRSKSGKLQEAHFGAAYLAAKSGAPVIPVGVVGTWDQEVINRLKRFRKAQVTARVGNAYTLPPLGAKNREEQLLHYTDEIMCQIAALLPEDMRGFYADQPRLAEILSQGG